ncbi:MAG: hypothetical protein M0P97_01430 [Candidatus Moranbacteria bacterium]|jgi:hypothetical protein|nr:hypothetical protein [Candidatus Moranbacteria bacterium]
MKKTATVALLMMFGFVFQTQAVSTNSNSTGGQVAQTGTAVATQEQNQVMNQGEDSQIQTQEQNEVYGMVEDETVEVADDSTDQEQAGSQTGTATGDQDRARTQTQDRIQTQDQEQIQQQDKTQDRTQSKTQDKVQNKTQTSSAKQVKSQVASAVQTMLNIAEGDSKIGQQIKTIAQNQTKNQEKIQKNIENIQSRSGFAKMLIGPNYGEIKDAKTTLEQNKLQIKELNQIRTQLSNESDQQMLTEQIKVLEESNQEIEAILDQSQSGFSFFGWFNNLVS